MVVLNFRKLIELEKEIKPWLKLVPYDITDSGIIDFLEALKTNKASRESNPGKKFTMRFKTKKALSDSLRVRDIIGSGKKKRDNTLFPLFYTETIVDYKEKTMTREWFDFYLPF